MNEHKAKKRWCVIISLKNTLKKKQVATLMEHAVICGCDAPVNRVGLTRQAMAFLTEPSFIHSLIHVTEGARALACFNLSTSVTNTSPLIQRSCTDLFALFNIIKKKKKEFLFPILHFLSWFGFVRWVCKTVQASLIFFQQSIIRLRLPYLLSISFGFLSFSLSPFLNILSLFSLVLICYFSEKATRNNEGLILTLTLPPLFNIIIIIQAYMSIDTCLQVNYYWPGFFWFLHLFYSHTSFCSFSLIRN